MARTTGNAKDLITFTRASTGTFLGSNGLLQTAAINTPRVEYDANGVAKGLLIEEARTNLEAYSEEIFNRAIWTSSPSGSETENAATAPDESISADYIYGNAAGGGSVYKYRSYTLTASTPYTFSVFAKKADSNWIFIRSGSFDASSNVYVWFDLENGVQGSEAPSSGTTLSAVSITPLQNGWYRCSITVTLGTDNTGLFQIGVVSADGNIPYAAGETVGTYLWGAQLEQGSFPTSYIPTSGATATRSADIASVSVSEFGYNQAQGSVVVEAETFDNSVTNHGDFALVNSGSQNDIASGSRSGGTAAGTYTAWFKTGGSTQALLTVTSAVTSNTNYKAAFCYAANDFALTVDASAIVSDTSGTVPTFADEVKIGTNTYGYLNGHIKSINYYPLRLSDAKLQELTS